MAELLHKLWAIMFSVAKYYFQMQKSGPRSAECMEAMASIQPWLPYSDLVITVQ